MTRIEPHLHRSVCATCGGARVEVILGTVLACGRCRGSGVEPAAELRGVLSDVVTAYDYPADGSAHARMRAAIVAAREALDLPPVRGVDGEPA